MASSDYLARVLAAFGDAFRPLQQALSSQPALAQLLGDLGWDLDPSADLSNIRPAFDSVGNAINQLARDSSKGEGAETLGRDVSQLTVALLGLASNTGAGLPAPLSNPAFWKAFAPDLLQYLVYQYLEGHAALAFGVLRFVGILREEPGDPDPTTARHAFARLSVDWARFPTTVTHAGHLFQDVYSWGSDFKYALLMDNVAALLRGFQTRAQTQRPPDSILNLYYDRTNSDRSKIRAVIAGPRAARLGGGLDTAIVKLSFVLLPIPSATDGKGHPVGIALVPLVTGDGRVTLPITDNVSLTLSGHLQTSFIRAEIRPSGTRVNINPPTGEVDAAANLIAHRTPPWLVAGDADGMRLALEKAHTGLLVQGSASEAECKVQVAIESAKLVLDFRKGDGFIQKILGALPPQDIEFNLTLEWSSKTGFSVHGQAALEAEIPLHLNLANILVIDTILIGLRAGVDDSAVNLVIAVTGQLALGPLLVKVTRVGIKASARPRDASAPGNLGLLDFGVGFKSPDGLGLSVNASAITGGGFLLHDDDKQQYAGALQLAFNGISLTAVGLLTTRMPDGSAGFSLLIIITAKFPPIALGFGFSLTGVGGLLGLNRTMVLEVLREGVKNRTLDSIMFPEHPIENAPKLVSDLSRVFPPAPNRFVIGPMAIITWGNPECILTAQLGIIIEIPAPVRLAVLGKLTMALPNAELPAEDILILIHMDVVGTIDFQKGDISIDATLYNSRITTFALSGDMALRANVGANPNFALAVGGFNPRFQPPPNFPTLSRLTLSLATSDNPRLRLETYLALTSNTLQFGADLDFRYELSLDIIGRLAIAGNLGFDVLFHFSPFQLEADMGGQLWVYANNSPLVGIGIDLHLTGPAPWWHAWGTGTINFLGKHTVSFDLPKAPPPDTTPLPAGHPGADLVAALGKPSSWSAQLPPDGQTLVSLHETTADGQVFAHPLGQLTVRQKVVPLDVTITRYGNTAPDDGTCFRIKSAKGVAADLTPVQEYFAPGNFFALSDDEKLSRPSFELQDAGVQFGRTEMKCGATTTAALTYDERILVRDPKTQQVTPQAGAPYKPSANVVATQTNTGARARSPMLTTGAVAYRASGLRVTLKPPTFTLTHEDRLTTPQGITPKTGLSYTQAIETMQKALAAGLDAGRGLQVIATWEKKK